MVKSNKLHEGGVFFAVVRRFEYIEPGEIDEGPIKIILTEDEIIERYWDYWCYQMIKVGKQYLISKELCIEDFIIVHWAYEIEE